MSPGGKTNKQIDHILIHMRRQLSVHDVRSFRAADCDNGHYLVVAKVRERLAVKEQTSHRFHKERFNFNKVNKLEGKEEYHNEVLNRSAASEDLGAEGEINSAWKTIRENTKFQPKRV
jgi:hypothetical protein